MADELMTPELVQLGVTVDGDKHAVIAAMASLIASTGRAERDGLEKAMLDREATFATGKPGGHAIPHCRTTALNHAAHGY